jgi:hypothetical protein
MTLGELKKKVLALIEELNPESEHLTDDPDISAKHNDVINQVLYEMVRIKKVPKYIEMEVSVGDLVDFEQIGDAVGYDVYQLATVGGVANQLKASGTVIKILESGTAEIECYVYPERITATTKDSYEFEVSADVLEIMPYGVAADLLKSDVSTEYGAVYDRRFKEMIERLDPRYAMTSVTIEGGVDV